MAFSLRLRRPRRFPGLVGSALHWTADPASRTLLDDHSLAAPLGRLHLDSLHRLLAPASFYFRYRFFIVKARNRNRGIVETPVADASLFNAIPEQAGASRAAFKTLPASRLDLRHGHSSQTAENTHGILL
ncbi:hypothetical protein CC78DRAFT_573996 [Lojkania enalia]|uniref:Uncharacterized protein n=1 Tax=Lojkania enalia TaxID=147567 RepID=A0A9P4NCN6_9PLEO|nr:hypothetical protein CC78DRAFT_573996 [Didymosphaeria enalia]